MNMPPVGTNPMGHRQSLDGAMRPGKNGRRKVPESNVSLLPQSVRKFAAGPGRKLTFREKERIEGIVRDLGIERLVKELGGNPIKPKLDQIRIYKAKSDVEFSGLAGQDKFGRPFIMLKADGYEKDYTDGKASVSRTDAKFARQIGRPPVTSGGHVFLHEITHALQLQGVLPYNITRTDDYNYKPEIRRGVHPFELGVEDMAAYVMDKYGHRFDGKPNPGSLRVPEPPTEKLRRNR